MIKGIYGINVAVKDLRQAVTRYEAVFGVKSHPLEAQDFAFPGLLGAKLDVNGFYITLISSSDSASSVSRFIERRGEGVFLLSVEVDDIEDDTKVLSQHGLQFALDRAATGRFGAVNFAHPKSMNGVQLELYEPQQTA